MIPMVDVQQQYQQLKDVIDEGVLGVLASGQYVLGPQVRAFEEVVADYLGVEDAIGVASGTDALHLALVAAGIGPGDEVITSPFTFIATVEAILYVGATPVFVDIDPRTFNLDVNQLEGAMTPATAAILPVHLYGQPADMDPIMALAEKNNIIVIEDCAQSFGATYNGKQTGCFGELNCFSFYPSKNIGCFGDGGMVTTKTKAMGEVVRQLRNHGSSQRYYHQRVGFNSRLDEIQAAILQAKFPHLDTYNKKRGQVALWYDEAFADTAIVRPYRAEKCTHIFHQYTILHENRDVIANALRSANIGCAIYYPVPLHQQIMMDKAYHSLSFPNAEQAAVSCLSLPMFPEMTQEQVLQVTGKVLSVCQN
ncbi:MAG: DegT/DnrJ/EryC1/StrS family aminotransferase [Gammaproteobacteria bacterium]